MSKQVLYRAYRSRSFDEVVGQDQVTTTLKSAIDEGRVAHAYLFVGPRGVGKTSVARVFAFAVNNLKYDDQGHIDIIEIDAASNRRIDEIRELRDKIHISPLEAKYKVYIIDEVHMLTREAFNALLKTLEEPPAHVIFVLATTEAHKVPETISSRTQKFVFRPISPSIIKDHLKTIASKEKIKAEDEALEIMAEHAEGSFRDGISLFDQLSSSSELITAEKTRKFLGYGSSQTTELLIKAIETGKLNEITQIVGELLRHGAQVNSLSLQLIDSLRRLEPTRDRLELIDGLLAVSSAHLPHIALEVTLLKSALKNAIETSKVEPEPETAKPSKTTKSDKKVSKLKTTTDQTADISQWAKVLGALKTTNHSLYAVLRLARVEIDEDMLKLTFVYKFHARRLDDKKPKDLVLASLNHIWPSITRIEIEVDESAKPTLDESDLDQPSLGDDDTVSSVINTFGGGEVVEV